MLFDPYTRRADITTISATQVQFAVSAGLSYRPIKLAAPSGRQASLSALPSALTISGSAGTKYIFADLAAPSGDGWATLLTRIRSALPWNRADWFEAFRGLRTGDGSLALAAQNSVVTLVMATAEAPATTHQIPLGEVVWSGTAITSINSYENQVAITISAFIHGQCQLIKSGTDLKLIPFNGATLVMDGVARSIPAAGVTLAPTGLTVGSTYLIFANWTGSAIALSSALSSVGHTTHTDGVEIFSGFPAYTLVGMARITTGPAFLDTDANRWVRSWFNDYGVAGRQSITADRSTTSTSFVHLNVEARISVLLWANEGVLATVSGEASNSTADAEARTGIGFDSTTAPEPGVALSGVDSSARVRSIGATVAKTGLSEGNHEVNICVSVSAGTGTWEGTTSPRVVTLNVLTVR